jgi:hypothetical protein
MIGLVIPIDSFGYFVFFERFGIACSVAKESDGWEI